MKKNLFQDMVKVKKEQREILIKKDTSALKRETVAKPKPKKVEERVEEKITPKIREKTREKVREDLSYYHKTPVLEDSSNRTHYGLWLVAAVSIVFLFFAFSAFFAKAHITINPKINDIVLSDTILANKDLSVADEGLSYQLIVLEAQNSKNIQGGEEKEVKEKAKGVAVLYNAFGPEVQFLDINTRLEGSNGKIYRTDTKVSIPPLSDIGIPGSVEVGITALEDGEAYNSGPLDFTVLGYKNTSKYKKIYGRSQGDIVGGFKGLKKLVNEEEKAQASKELETSLEVTLLQKAIDQIPPGYILFKDATFFKFESELGESRGVSEVPVILKGTLYGFLLEEKDLTKEIMKIKFPSEKSEDIYIKNIKDLSFVLTDRDVSFEEATSISFKLNGPVKIVSYINDQAIIKDLLGESKKDFKNILSKYKNIESADLVVKPIWESSIPKEKEDIIVKINYPE